MHHKRRTTTGSPFKPSLPTPGPLNIATREYYRPSATLDTNDATLDYPESDSDKLAPSPVPQQQDPFSPNDVVESEDVYDFVEVSKARVAPHSPTISEILLCSDLRDVRAMSTLDRELRRREISSTDRKRSLLELQDKLIEARKKSAEKAEEAKDEQLEREYVDTQRRGREDV